MTEVVSVDDPYDLRRFVDAQAEIYDQALSELRGGRKQSHWMWFIFPQFAGLGESAMSVKYSIKSLEEARVYLLHPLLGARLVECAEALLEVQGRTALQILGSPDEMKLRSCATLFSHVSPADNVFDRILGHYFQGERDRESLRLLQLHP